MVEMNIEEVKKIIKNELPKILKSDPSFRRYILQVTKLYYPPKKKTEDRIEQIYQQILQVEERFEKKWEEWSKRWEETQAEWNRKWEESQKRWEETQAEWNRKWEENQKTINQILLRLEKIDRRHLYTIGALGARWGLYSEESFRNGLKAIIEESFRIEVMRYIDYDHTGEVFGHPDQIELDLIIRNGMVIACEIKSSMSKSDMYTLWREKEFYERKHQRKVDRVIVISPMVDPRAKPVAEKLGIEIYTHSDEFVETEEKNIEDITK
ncbi:PD-(D/E)XK nuclease family protein [Thermodesulfovibrio yellowstonii]|uniref:PD-(D/E)XK nuclease family protein n=1 Tax=Thermodesulfovibrio yellowstonii TaxID=28262 RepID=UPI0024B38480|nr:DUF3782 domain-containing protein [Thermodesulfovibrio yellowstonii]MDI6865562.1 DUF3782 domain-containing protein [Thermodesulfovibrio yellowstonii]